ncbi:MAG: DNA-binding response regulator, AraC family [Candidatus Saccharicenans subterraneus]|uniref:DNA-binding response regulator, AraC family n=1 Tax=Candidatus Saccharicenans subterraneus TaxID=2508984 RepID=A0A3E2BJ88_9BACT|nr:MAG: DNA-binding response regulator, AraC family [Candidatus Saccharicenans subterraneum]
MSGCVRRKIFRSFRSFLSAQFPSFLSPLLSPLLFLLILSLLLPPATTPLYSQLGPHLLFRNISIEKGLSQNSVLSVAVDHEGFLWFGTESGLNKFDGYQFTVYLPIEGDPNSLSNSWINALLVDHTGTLWAGTENGLNEFIAKREQFIHYLHEPSNPKSLSSSRILTLFEDREGRLWIGTDRGLNLFDRNTKIFIRYQHNPARPHQTLSSDQVRAITQDRLGYIWIGTAGGGLNRLDPSTGQIIQIRAGAVAPVLPGYENETASASPTAPNLISVRNAPFTATSSEITSPTSTALDSNSAVSSSAPQTTDPAPAPRYLPPPTSHVRISSSLPDDFINALLIEPEPRPAGSDHGRDSSSQSSRSTPSSADIIWIGTASSGLIRYLPASGEFKIYYQAPAIAPANAGNPALVPPGSPAAALSTRPASSLPPQSPQSLQSPQSPKPLQSTPPSSSPQASPSATLHTSPQILPDLSSISDNAVNCLIRDHDGSLWVGTDSGGLNHFYPSNGIFISYKYKSYDLSALPDNRVLALLRTPDDILWIGTYRGISQLNLERQYFKRFLSNPQDPFSLQQPAVRAFCEHSSGFTYVGTDGGGISAFDLEHKIVFHLRADPRNPDSPYSLSSDRIFCLLEDRDADHTLWVGTLYGGLNRYNPATGRFIHYRANPSRPGSLPEDHIRSLLLDRNNTLWVGTVSSGLVYFDRTSNRFKRPVVNKINLNPPEAPARSAPSTSSAGSTGSKPAKPNIKGASYPAPKTDIALPDPINRGRIFYMVEDQKGNLWLADYETGLVRFNPSSGEVEIFVNDPRNPNSLSSNSIISVFIDSQGLVWAGTNGGGLNRLDPATLTFTRYNEAHGLPSSVIYSILEDDDGFLWLSTNRGLSRFDPRTKHFRNFDVHDGLQGYEFNGNSHLRSRSGHIYFGGINGFNVFNPREIKESDYRPPVRLTRLLIQNRPVRPEQQIDGKTILNDSLSNTRYLELTWKHRVVAFEFVALDYTSPDKNQYAYMLEGFDREWNYAGSRRFASYSNLPPGTYTFRVKATNCDGVWDEGGASLAIRVIPPFWRTWWFYLLEVLAVAGAFYWLYRYRLSRISRRQQELESLVAQRTEELRLVNDKLKLLAITDELTGLSNYRRFRDFLEYEWRRAHRTRRPLSVIITDLDDFKLFNDTYGHQAGDECLKKVALIMLKCCQRSSDLACRYGGDEFAIVLPETDTAGAYLVAERIREAIASTDFNDPKLKEINGHPPENNNNIQPVRLTMCLGLATMNPVEGGDTNELIARADQALYRAKTAGKNRTAV